MSFPEKRVQVCGLPWFAETSPLLWRLPERMAGMLPDGIFEAGKETSGVRLRFRTDTRSLSVRARYPKPVLRTNMTLYTTHGISTYANGRYWSSRICGLEGGEVELELFSEADAEMREITLYLPLYGAIEILEIGAASDARFEEPSRFSTRLPVVFYGTSITQGGCASRPGLSYQARLSRELHVDYVNMGFSGKGRCELSMAEVVSGIQASVYVIDVGQNNSVSELRERFGPFLKRLRERRPETPVLVTTPIFYCAELWSPGAKQASKEKREIIRSVVRERQEAGDTVTHLLDACEYLWRDFTEGSVDGSHPNDLGFARMAESMRPRLADILAVAG